MWHSNQHGGQLCRCVWGSILLSFAVVVLVIVVAAFFRCCRCCPQELEAKNGKISVDIFCKVAFAFSKLLGWAGLVQGCPSLNRGQWGFGGIFVSQNHPVFSYKTGRFWNLELWLGWSSANLFWVLVLWHICTCNLSWCEQDFLSIFFLQNKNLGETWPQK